MVLNGGLDVARVPSYHLFYFVVIVFVLYIMLKIPLNDLLLIFYFIYDIIKGEI